MGMNIHRGRDRKILSSIVELMEVSDSEEDFHVSVGNVFEEGPVKVNAMVLFEAAKYQSLLMKTLFAW